MLQLALAQKKQNQNYLPGDFESEGEIKGEGDSEETTQLMRMNKNIIKQEFFLTCKIPSAFF